MQLGQQPVSWAGGVVPGLTVSAWGPIGNTDLGVRRRPNGSETPGAGAQFSVSRLCEEKVAGLHDSPGELLLSYSSSQPGHASPHVLCVGGRLLITFFKEKVLLFENDLKMIRPG